MIKIAYFKGGRDKNGRLYYHAVGNGIEVVSPYISGLDFVRTIELRFNRGLKINLCKPGEAREGLICILSKDEAKLLKRTSAGK